MGGLTRQWVTAVTAPARRSQQHGLIASKPSQTLMSLVDEHDVWVVANLKETQLDEVDTRSGRADTTASEAHALVDHWHHEGFI